MNKPQTFNGDLSNLPPALQPFTSERRWVSWRWRWVTGKKEAGRWTKPPYRPDAPKALAKNNDASTWGTYPDAVRAVERGDGDGIGIMLLGAALGAADLDHCRNASTGAIDDWAQTRVNEAGAYTETTVSGGGLRILGLVHGAPVHRKFAIEGREGAAIELYRDTARYITVSGLQIGDCSALPDLDPFLDHELARLDPKQVQDIYDYSNAAPQRETDYDRLIRQGAPVGQRSREFNRVVFHLAAQGLSVDQIVARLAEHPNGIASKYGPTRLYGEVQRSYAKRARTLPGAAPAAPAAGSWPVIVIRDGEGPRIANEAEQALVASHPDEFFDHGGRLVRTVVDADIGFGKRTVEAIRLIEVTPHYLVDRLTCSAQFQRFDLKRKKFVPIDCPERTALTLLHREGRWKAIRRLRGIASAPFLRPDGSAVEAPGYDPDTGILFKASAPFPALPVAPTKADADAALDHIDRMLLTGFPFVEPVHKSVALAGLLTALDRRGMATAPLFGISAPSPGTGKSLLVDLISILATGFRAAVIDQGTKDEEFEKHLDAKLLEGAAMFAIDNIERPLKGAALCQTLTSERRSVRIFGEKRTVDVPMVSTLFANGNNLIISGDLVRRSLICKMDAQVEQPELRRFDFDVIGYAIAHRAELIIAALTVLRAWHCTPEDLDLTPFGSFEDWSHRVRAPLVWLGRPDPVMSQSEARGDDPEWANRRLVILEWRDRLGTESYFTTKELIGRAQLVEDFHSALLAVAADKSGKMVSNERLGRWLHKNQGKIVGGVAFRKIGSVDNLPRWQLTTIMGP